MDHLLLLLYLFSGLSGLSTIVYLLVKYGNKTVYMKEYIKIHISYTVLILSALVIIYLRVNVVKSPMIMSIFVSAVLLWQGILCWLLPRFVSVMGKSKTKKQSHLLWTILPFCYLVLAVLQFFLIHTRIALLPLIIGVSAFFLMMIWFTFNNFFSEESSESNNSIWIFFFIFTLVVIGIEMALKYFYGFLGEYPINIPLIFLCWNALSLYQFKQFKAENTQQISDFIISEESINKWKLTEREVEIITSIAKGASNKEIAYNLNLSFSTVKNHVYNIYKKTGARSRVDILNLIKPSGY